MVNLKQYYSGKVIFIILGLFAVFLLIIASCFGIFTWVGSDVLRNIDLGRKNGFVYYELINFDNDIKELTKKMSNEVEKSFENYIQDLKKVELLSDFSIDLLNNFSLNVYLTFNEKEFFVFLIDAIKYSSSNKNINSDKLLDLLESGNLMLKLDEDKLIVVLPVLNAFLQNSNATSYSRLESIINTVNSNNVLKNKDDYLIPNGDFYIRFIFSVDDLKFKLDSFDFNDSWVVKQLIGDEVNAVLNNDDKNMIYKNFFDFGNWGGALEDLNVKLGKINIEDGYFKATLSLSYNLN